VQVNKDIERFTVGRDREMDLYLAKHDVLGSMAHITMLESIGLLTKEELEQLLAELKNIYELIIYNRQHFNHLLQTFLEGLLHHRFHKRIDIHPDSNLYFAFFLTGRH